MVRLQDEEPEAGVDDEDAIDGMVSIRDPNDSESRFYGLINCIRCEGRRLTSAQGHLQMLLSFAISRKPQMQHLET